jgi:hypothetical protein
MDAGREAPVPDIDGAAAGGKIMVRVSTGRVPTCLRSDIGVRGALGSAWNAGNDYRLAESIDGVTTSYGGVAQPHGSRIGGIHLNPLLGRPTLKDIDAFPEPD